MSEHATALSRHGFVWVREADLGSTEAFELASELLAGCCAAGGGGKPAVIGDFVLPPPDAPQTRDFQTLHFDFGLPVVPRVPRDLGRFTALHVPPAAAQVSASTRLVPLRALLGQRGWPRREQILERLASYGRTHGAWQDEAGYVEGSLARLVEAVAGKPTLPSVKAEPGFLCGMEFESLDAELAFFRRHALSLERVAIEVALQPGDLLVFDNLALAHGRRGVRRASELRQWVFGHQELDVAGQIAAREAVLSAFANGVALADGESVVPSADGGCRPISA